MWFAEQLNSFLNLGICKEYPIMARAKSTTGKSNRKNQEVVVTSSSSTPVPEVSVPEVKDAPQVAAQPGTSEIKVKNTANPVAPAAPVAAVVSEPKKFEIRKTEPRKNVVPINIEEEIRRRAYELYKQRGPHNGSEAEDWLNAEREVMQRYHQQSAAS
jgi:hypothetical protein